MLKLIIVDDEKTTRESLQEFVRWDTFGIGIVETAKNGLAALELAEKSRPDILLTDVRMPKMDGIQLASRVRELYPDCKIIFISGYSDKDYLKSAIHLKAVSYIEKPVNLEEVEAVIAQAVAACMDDERKRRDTERLESSLTRSRPLIRQEIALGLIEEGAGRTKLLNGFDDPFLEIPEAGLFGTACIRLNWKPGADDKLKSSVRHDILDLLGDNALFDPAGVITGVTADGSIAVILSGSSAEDCKPGGLPDVILKKLEGLSADGFTASIGIGSSVKTMSGLPGSYKEAVAASGRQFYYGAGRIYYYGRNGKPQFKPDKNLFDNFKGSLKKDDRESASALVRRLTESVRLSADENIDHIKNIYFNLLLLIFETAREKGLIDPAEENEKSYIWQEIDEIKTLSELSDYIGSNIAAVFNRFDSADNSNRKTYEIMKYIRENYHNRELSIQMIANNAYLSQTYLCSFFKKSTGRTLNEYITEVRIEKAKEFLRDRRIKLYEVTVRIGFTDSNYFSTLFKKYAGCTPSEYREKHCP